MSVSDPEQLAIQIEAGREQLGATVEELVHRLDVKSQAQRRIAETRQQVHDRVDSFWHTVQRRGSVARQRAGRAWRRPEVRRGTQVAAALTVGVLVLRGRVR